MLCTRDIRLKSGDSDKGSLGPGPANYSESYSSRPGWDEMRRDLPVDLRALTAILDAISEDQKRRRSKVQVVVGSKKKVVYSSPAL